MSSRGEFWEAFEGNQVAAAELTGNLSARGLSAAEVYWKSGTSRRFEQRFGVFSEVRCREHGWAVRAGDDQGSSFVTGAGAVPRDLAPTTLGLPLRLPEATTLEQESGSLLGSPDEFRPTGERAVLGLFDEIAQRLRKELPAAELLLALAEEGQSRSGLINSKGLEGASYRRVASLRLWAVDRSSSRAGGGSAWLLDIGSSLSTFDPERIAARLVDRLSIVSQGAQPERSVDPVLLAPEVMARLLAGLAPLFCQVELWQTLRSLESGALGGPKLTLLDEPGFGGASDVDAGVFVSPRDDEGVSCETTVLIEAGTLVQPLLPWFTTPRAVVHEDTHCVVSAGCRWRRSYREPPRVAPSHFYLQRSSECSVRDLVSRLDTGFYLVVSEPPKFDYKQQTFWMKVAGFRVEKGEPTAPVAGAALTGSFAALLKGVAETGRDLRFSAHDGMIGSPSVVVEGLTLLPTP